MVAHPDFPNAPDLRAAFKEAHSPGGIGAGPQLTTPIAGIQGGDLTAPLSFSQNISGENSAGEQVKAFFSLGFEIKFASRQGLDNFENNPQQAALQQAILNIIENVVAPILQEEIENDGNADRIDPSRLQLIEDRVGQLLPFIGKNYGLDIEGVRLLGASEDQDLKVRPSIRDPSGGDNHIFTASLPGAPSV